VSKYGLSLSDAAKACLSKETPKSLSNVESKIVGSVRLLCEAAAKEAEQLCYKAEIMTDSMDCEASDAGKMLAKLAIEWTDHHNNNGLAASNDNSKSNAPRAFIYGGETVVHIKGNGKGGRNQELALTAAREIEGLDNVLIFSFGSDGTDGPTDAAGGIVDGRTASNLREKGIPIEKTLADNDSYNALKAVDALIITGPTGTNVNDVSVLLVQP
jgi:hydroxypyruvate reductase